MNVNSKNAVFVYITAETKTLKQVVHKLCIECFHLNVY